MQTLTDTLALSRNRARATEMFLREHVADDVQERLEEVNRSFTSPLIVTPTPALWSQIVPDAPTIPVTETDRKSVV